ncbi:MAG TPA: lanthionine synthetase C family protein [Thermoanaerobaculia bacterium]|nr:lanthionine synthetase C family protein [Thermoanaerobaculia bacterium]
MNEFSKPDSSWRPLLDGEMADRALEAVFAIAEDIPTRSGWVHPRVTGDYSPVWSAGLASGAAGQALFYGYLALHTNEERWADLALELLDRAAEAVASNPMTESLYSGFPGIAWVSDHLRGRLFEGDPDENREIDEALLSAFSHPDWPREYDLINGLVGLGIYALEGLPRPTAAACLERIVERLAARALDEPEGAAWFSPPEVLPEHQRLEQPEGLYNLGASHGMAGVVALLGAASRAGVAAAPPLLERAMSWLLARRVPAERGFCFPHFYVPGSEVRGSRVAWCYGDPGMAAALLVAGRGAGDPAWERIALEVGRDAAGRPEEQARVQDAGLCHGATGVAHIFHRLHCSTGDAALAEAAQVWYERALRYRIPGLGFGGFRAWSSDGDGNLDWREDPGFLEGSAGIGLALLAAVSPVDPGWDRVFLESLREPELSPPQADATL